MPRRPVCDLDDAFVKLCAAQEALKDALALVTMALTQMPAPSRSSDDYEEPTYIGGTSD